MKRRIALVVVGAAVVLWILWLRGRPATTVTGVANPGSNHAPSALVSHRAAVDVHGAARGTIRGTVRDEHGAAIADARVCADPASWFLASAETEVPSCTATDAQGHYQIANLIPADYEVGAGAPHFRMAVYEAEPVTHRRSFALEAGKTRDGVDLVLRAGGVEITGTVNDIAGGPIAHAQVRASRNNNERGPVVETDAQGRFSLWVDRGTIGLAARVDGYAPTEVLGTAPGTFELLLTPEGSLAGRVIDAATNAPVAGARVRVVDDSLHRGQVDVSDDDGRFHVEHLAPGRYLIGATTDHGYGATGGSVLVGLGQHVDGVTVKLYPAHQVVAHVVVTESHAPNDGCGGALHDRAHDRTIGMRAEPGGALVADGVIAGSYRVMLYCKQVHTHEPYPPVVVADADVAVTWEVDAGATIRGKVTTHSGEPVEGAELYAHGTGADHKSVGAFDQSHADGAFALGGLTAGHYEIMVHSDRGTGPAKGFEVDVPAGATVIDHDLVLDAGGVVTGTVRDAAGKPAAGVRVTLVPLDKAILFGPQEVRVDASGGFRIEGVRPGTFQVIVERGRNRDLRKPGTTDDATQGERVVIRAGETSHVDLVVEAEDGHITGTVRDATGKPVSDAFVSSARESDAAGARGSSVASTRDSDWWGEDRPALTGTDGAFTLDHLAPGTYTLRAYRKGGGEAIAEHVAVGGTAALQIKPTGSIAGTVHAAGGALPQAIQIAARDAATGFTRSDWFYRSDGQFTLSDLPAGHFDLTATGDGGHGTATVDLGDGQVRTGVTIELAPRVDVTGVLVEDGTQIPVPGMRMIVTAAGAGTGAIRYSNDDGAISDAQGRFTVHDVVAGKLYVRGFPVDFQNSPYAYFTAVRTIAPGSASPVDLGAIGVLRARTKLSDPIGQLGLNFTQAAPNVPFEQHPLEISGIDPKGPAAASGLKVGDVITACDGKDVTGDNAGRWQTLIRASPGTKLALTTQRGPTYTVTLAPP